MSKKSYLFSKNEDFWIEERQPIQYASCHDGLVVLSGTLLQHPFDGSRSSITLPEEINGIPVTELRTRSHNISSICSVGIRRVFITVYQSFYDDGCLRCSAPNLCGGMQNTIREMHLVFEGDDLRLGSFAGCEHIHSVTFRNEVNDDQDWDCTSFPPKVFANCVNLKHIHGTMKGQLLTGSTFRNCSSLVTLPNLYVQQMGDHEFENCTSLKRIHLHNGLTGIGDCCFANCTSLEDLYIPDTVRYLHTGVFKNCTHLDTIHLPDNISCIPDETFMGCLRLKKVFVPKTVERIGEKAFKGCHALTDIFIPDGVSIIDDEAFRGSGLQSIHTSSNIKKFGNRAFAECTNLKRFFMPENIVQIGDRCFEDCLSLKAMRIPASASVGDQIFKGCYELEKVELPQKLKSDDIREKLGLPDKATIFWYT